MELECDPLIIRPGFVFLQNWTTSNMAEDPLDDLMLICRTHHCNNHGDCVIQDGLQVCKCMLGYKGDTCQGTVNDGLAVPLTLGVLGFIVAFIALAFVIAFVQQRRRERLWYDIEQYFFSC